MSLVQNEPAPRKVISLTAAALQLGVSVDTIRRYLDNGHLDGFRLPTGERRVFADSVDRIIAGGNAEVA